MAEVIRTPTSDTFVNGTISGTPGSRFANVDDYPDDAGADVLTLSTTNSEINFGLTGDPVPAGATDIIVLLEYYDRKDAAPVAKIRPRVVVAGSQYPTDTSLDHDPVNGVLTARSDPFATSPHTLAAWTVDDVNGTGANPLQGAGVRSPDASPSVAISSFRVRITFTPVAGGVTATPGTGSLTLTGFAPSVAAGNNVAVTPGTASVILTGNAPTVTASDHVTVTPGTASIIVTGPGASVSTTAHVTVTPGVAGLTITGFAPTVTATQNVRVTPATAALLLTGFAATINTGGNVAATPGTASLALTGFAPAVQVSDHKVVTPGAAAITLTGFPPTVTVTSHVVVAPGVGSFTLTGFAATVTVTAHVVATPGTAGIVLTGFAPSLPGAQIVVPGVGTIIVTGYAPTISTAAVPIRLVLPLTGRRHSHVSLTGHRHGVEVEISAEEQAAAEVQILSVEVDPFFASSGETVSVQINATPPTGGTVDEYELEDLDASGAIIVPDGVVPGLFAVTIP